jgi:uncharacterized membrane-anchored protein
MKDAAACVRAVELRLSNADFTAFHTVMVEAGRATAAGVDLMNRLRVGSEGLNTAAKMAVATKVVDIVSVHSTYKSKQAGKGGFLVRSLKVKIERQCRTERCTAVPSSRSVAAVCMVICGVQA